MDNTDGKGGLRVTQPQELSPSEQRRRWRVQKRMSSQDNSLRVKRMLTSVDDRKKEMDESQSTFFDNNCTIKQVSLYSNLLEASNMKKVKEVDKQMNEEKTVNGAGET